jgi:hypothetical protein
MGKSLSNFRYVSTFYMSFSEVDTIVLKGSLSTASYSSFNLLLKHVSNGMCHVDMMIFTESAW